MLGRRYDSGNSRAACDNFGSSWLDEDRLARRSKMRELIHRTSPAKPRSPGEGRRERGPAPPPPPPWRNWLILIGVLFTLLILFAPGMGTGKVTTLTYSQFVSKVTAN